MMTRCVIALFIGIMSLTSCQIGPVYEPPCVEVSAEWKGPVTFPEALPNVENWWEIFNEEQLDCLEEMAISNSPDLTTALARIEEAWAQAGIDKAILYPQLSLNPTYQNTGTLFKIYLPQNIPFLQGFAQDTLYRIHQMLFSFPLNLSYEVDLWGKNRKLYESSKLHAQAQEEAYRTALLSLTADVASSYYQIRTLDTTLALLEKILESRQRDFNLNQTRFEKGLVGAIDVSQAEVLLETARSDYLDVQRQRAQQENFLATLLGIPPSELMLPIHPLQEPPPLIPVDLPSRVLLQRPDVARAERQAAAEHALIGAAYASFFPTFSLTGTLGFLSPDYREFMCWKSRYWSYTAALDQPLFDGGRRSSNLELAIFRFREASADYQKVVLNALMEVENALIALDYEREQNIVLERAAQAAQKTVGLAKNRYRSGLVNFTEVVDSERSEYNTILNYANIKGMQFQTTIQLIKALGGSWNLSEVCEHLIES